MSSRIPTSKIHLKRNSHELSNNSSKFSSAKLLKTDRCYDSRTSFKGLQDTKYESAIMKRIMTETKQQQLLRTPTEANTHTIPDLEFRSHHQGHGKALTQRRETEVEYGKVFQLSNFQKKKSTDRSNHERLPNERRVSSNFSNANKYYQLQNQYAIQKYQESECILVEKNKRVNDLQRLNKFFLKRAEELSGDSQELTLKNTYLKSQLKHFQGVVERIMRLEQKCSEIESRDQNDTLNYESQKQEIYTLTKMC